MTPPPEPVAGSVANERTTLAWSRTTFSFVAVGALVARQTSSVPLAVAVLMGVMATAAVAMGAADRRYWHRHRHLADEQGVLAVRGIVAVAGAAVVLALCAVVIVLA